MSRSDRSSSEGGYTYAIRKMDREQPDIYALSQWRAAHRETPTSERTAWWVGVDSALNDAISAHPECEEVA